MAEARLAELVAALSLGIDLGFGQPMEHVLRQCLISLRLAEQLGLDDDARADVYYTALLINVGCHSDAHEQAKWFGDDFASKAIKYDHEPRSLRMVATGLSYLGHGHPPLHRFRLGLEFVLSGRREVDGMIESHSQIARMLGEQLGALGRQCSTSLADGVRTLGRPRLARRPERRPGSPAGAHLTVRRVRRGRQSRPTASTARSSSPAGVAASSSTRRSSDALVAGAREILPQPEEASSWTEVIAAEPGLSVRLDDAQFDSALAAIASFVDLKSPYFLGHARAVAELAAEAAPEDAQLMRRAGLVHDWGRLGVSNAILDKRGPLGAGEWERLRLQRYITERMLQQSEALAPLRAERPPAAAAARTGGGERVSGDARTAAASRSART